MTEKGIQEWYVFMTKTAFKIITPWKKRAEFGSRTAYPSEHENRMAEDEKYYVQGWNDCLKEIKKNRAKYLKNLAEYIDEKNL